MHWVVEQHVRDVVSVTSRLHILQIRIIVLICLLRRVLRLRLLHSSCPHSQRQTLEYFWQRRIPPQVLPLRLEFEEEG